MTRTGHFGLTRRLLAVRLAGAQDAVQRVHGGGGVHRNAGGRGDGGAGGLDDGTGLEREEVKTQKGLILKNEKSESKKFHKSRVSG